MAWGNTNGHVVGPGSRHVPQKSLSDAIRTIRTRKGSVSANAQELAEALKAPVSFKLIVRYYSKHIKASVRLRPVRLADGYSRSFASFGT